MKMVKSLLLGAAAGFVAVAGAQAADMPVKAKPVLYVKICSLYGDGFYYIPGTDTCLKMGGYLRVQGEYNMGAGGVAIGTATNEAPQARFTRDLTNDFNYRTRGAISWDVRQQTEYGTLRSYIRFGAENTTPATSGAGTAFGPFWDRAFIQFAGFTVGRTQSFFDLFTYGGGMSYHNVRVAGDTGAAGLTVWAYTAQFGNGVSGTLSIEDPAGHNKAGTFDMTLAGFWSLSGVATTADNAFQAQNAAANGFRGPDIIANLRMDQAWGFIGISGAVHDASGAYYGGVNNVVNGHPADKMGWSVAAGTQINLPGGDQWGINGCYAQGAVGFCANSGALSWTLWNAGASTGFGFLSDGVFDVSGSEVQLTTVWSFLSGYQHIWNPQWRTAIGGGYVNVSYNSTAATLITSHIAGSLAGCGVVAGAATLTGLTLAAGNSCSPNFSFYEIYTRTQYNPTPNLDIGLEIYYVHLNTAYKGPAVVAASGSQTARGLVDDQNVWSAMFRWQRNFYP